MAEQLIRIPKVQETTGLARSTIYSLVEAGKFPAPIKVTGRASAWVSKEVAEWVSRRIVEGRQPKCVISAGSIKND